MGILKKYIYITNKINITVNNYRKETYKYNNIYCV